MPTVNLDYILQACNVYVDGYSKLGWAEKISTPKIKKKMETFRGGGMLGGKKHALGYEPIEFDFDMSAYDPKVLSRIGLFSADAITISFTGVFDGDQNAQHAANFVTRAKFEETDAGAWEPGKKAMLKAKGSCDAVKLTIDNAIIYDIDIDAQKWIINGVDEYAFIRANI